VSDYLTHTTSPSPYRYMYFQAGTFVVGSLRARLIYWVHVGVEMGAWADPRVVLVLQPNQYLSPGTGTSLVSLAKSLSSSPSPSPFPLSFLHRSLFSYPSVASTTAWRAT